MKTFKPVLVILIIFGWCLFSCSAEKEEIAVSGDQIPAESQASLSIAEGKIPKLEELDPIYQYGDEEWKELMAELKMEPAIEIDKENSVKAGSSASLLLLGGILIRGPFYIQEKDDQLFINGYKYYPGSLLEKVRMPKKVTDEIEREEKERERRKDNKALPIIFISDIIDKLPENLDSIEEQERWLRKELKKKRIKVKSIRVNKDEISIKYIDEYGEVSGFTQTTRSFAERMSKSKTLFPDKKMTKDERKKFKINYNKSQLISFINSYDFLYTSGAGSFTPLREQILIDIQFFLDKELDERIKIYLISENTTIGPPAAISILANKEKFTRTLR